MRLHLVDPPLDEFERRVAERNLTAPADAAIDPSDPDDWAALFELPSPAELALRKAWASLNEG